MRKRVLFWQKASFHTFAGGDGLYLHKLKLYFSSMGWEVITITSRVHRPYFYALSKYHIPGGRSKVRGAAQIGRLYLFGPIAILNAVIKFIANKCLRVIGFEPAERFSPLEEAWAKREIENAKADVVIKCFDRSGHKNFLEWACKRDLHLVGFMNNDEYVFKNNNITQNDVLDLDLANNFGGENLESAPNLPAIGFSSKFDRDRLRQHLPGRTSLFVGIGFASKFFDSTSSMNNVVFVGNKTTLNKVAAELLIEKIWPSVRTKVPDARLRIVGRVCEYLENPHAGVDLLGEVKDLDEEYENCKVVAAPLLVGSAGVKTKVAEGLAYGRVIVTTSLGVDSSDPNQLEGAAFVEDDPGRFAEIVIMLLINDDLRKKMESNARDVFAKNYSVASAYCEIEKWLSLDS